MPTYSFKLCIWETVELLRKKKKVWNIILFVFKLLYWAFSEVYKLLEINDHLSCDSYVIQGGSSIFNRGHKDFKKKKKKKNNGAWAPTHS